MILSEVGPIIRLQLALSIIALLAAGWASADITDSTEAEQALSDVVAQLNDLEQWLTNAQRQSAEIEQQIRAQDESIGQLVNSRDATRRELAQTQRSINELQRQQQQLQRQVDTQREAVVAHLQASSRLGGNDLVKQILNQQSGADLDRLLRYHRYLGAQRLATMEKFQLSLTQLDQTRSALDDKLREQSQREQLLNRQTRDLQSKRQERAQASQALAEQRKTKAEQQQVLLADSERLRRLLNQLRAQASALDGRAFAAAKGKLTLPLKGRLRHSFGDPRAGTSLRWEGLDVSGSVGAEVTAVFGGKVVFSDWLRGFGLIAIVDHGDGYMTLYGHADSLTKNAGDWVEGGEVIARAGNSGGGYEPGIYFELRHKGAVVDPQQWLSI